MRKSKKGSKFISINAFVDSNGSFIYHTSGYGIR